jgi:DNA repair exonuclease SbcCD ATPase subunit
MQIKSIHLKDFRQFYGEQKIEFATDSNKNVTLIHAENGVGKTTLLNSILWTFFGKTTSRFEQKDKIINFGAEKDGKNSAAVQIYFTHDEREYQAQRIFRSADGNTGKQSFSVTPIGANGAFEPSLPNPSSFINSVMPEGMAPYFFFDGEQAENFSGENNRKAIAAAIRSMLGSTLIETAIEDLQYLYKKFNEEIGEASGDSEIALKEKEITDIESAREKRNEKIGVLEGDIESIKAQLAAIASSLSQAQEAAQFQRERVEKERLKKSIEEQIKECKSEIFRWISGRALASVSEKLTAQSLDFIDEESLRGRIPSPYNEDFVKGLLGAQLCVCDRPLHPGSDEWRAITALLSSASNAEVLNRVVRVRARISVLKEQRREAPQILEGHEEKLVRLSAQYNILEREIEEVSNKIGDIPDAEIQQREAARRRLTSDLETNNTQRIRAIRDNELAQIDITRLSREVSDLALKNIAARSLVVRRDLAEHGKGLLEMFLKSNEHAARTHIAAAVNRVLEATARRDYKFEIDESFQIRLLFPDGAPTPKSGGENQMMSLAFLAALLEYTFQRTNNSEEDLFIPARIAPLVLDSPFGQLDDHYRDATAKFVPQMAPQVVLLVSSSQGNDGVYSALKEKIGREYVLIAHNQTDRGQKSDDVLDIGGEKIATTLFNKERNMTEVREVHA